MRASMDIKIQELEEEIKQLKLKLAALGYAHGKALNELAGNTPKYPIDGLDKNDLSIRPIPAGEWLP